MTDEELVAVLMWRGSALQEGAFFAAAARIEQLTAERDKWKTAFDESCNAWQQQCEYEMDRANKAAAERDRLREALIELIQQTHNCERELTEDLHHVDFCGESVPLTYAREALKGGGHE